MRLSRSAAFLFTVAVVLFASGAGCLQGFGVQRGTTPDGKPSVELCAEIARAQPSAAASGPSVASAAASGPSVASAAPPAPSAGVLRHAQ